MYKHPIRSAQAPSYAVMPAFPSLLVHYARPILYESLKKPFHLLNVLWNQFLSGACSSSLIKSS